MNTRSTSIIDIIGRREWDLGHGAVSERALHVTESLIQRLGLLKELDGHTGCVNCLEWNRDGSLLVSGSDDSQVILWEPYHQKLLQTIPTGHNGNIFSVKLLPASEDRVLATCAADCQIKVLDVPFGEVTHQCSCHQGRVKRLAVSSHLPYLVWSAGEDGLVMQLDLRVKHQCRPAGGGGSVLVNLQATAGPASEAKCVAVSPARPDLLAVGANDPFVRVYDRRMSLAVTYVAYSADGSQLLANLGGEQVYLFDASHPRAENVLDPAVLSRPAATEEPRPATPALPARLDELRQEANRCHQQQHFSQAIQLNSRAIRLRDNVPNFYSNRAAAFMKRAWNGDIYAALRDCQRTLALQPGHMKAGFRLCWCLLELGHLREAAQAVTAFRRRHPQQAASHAVRILERDLKEAQFHHAIDVGPTAEPLLKLESALDSPALSEQERCWRRLSADYQSRYCGHCNTTTDIKEANFFGRDGQFILAGSDDGTFFIWERQTAAIVRVLRGDATIVNCVQPHPRLCLLASSGIDSCVRLWGPLPEGAPQERCVADAEHAAQANQQRMNADPMDMMLLNFGSRVAGGDEAPGQGIPCRTS
ncbi:WD and tetratricopeptide repeats protein 1-like [Pollicipes pollicipes]|uniref:WD and tetratricopeptide repeats protein 1-like n=1 Tax=Pollicipes pollicipes TaxID=41117 RepID=UPI0018852867|nr:WD and tetratricopeptide repeats protein 1-like [Pollicipes pollicipes]